MASRSVLCDQEAPPGNEAANEAANEATNEAANEEARPPLDEAQRRLALQGFLCANYNGLRRRLSRHLGCADMAAECLNDAWLRLGHLEVHALVQNPGAYVYRVACNVAMDRMRGSRSWPYPGDADGEIEQLADDTPGPERIAQARAELAAVQRAMDRLPRRHRSVLVALRIDELTREEVAGRYALSLRGVDTALRQALDYCAGSSGRQVQGGVSAPRRALRPLTDAHEILATQRSRGYAVPSHRKAAAIAGAIAQSAR